MHLYSCFPYRYSFLLNDLCNTAEAICTSAQSRRTFPSPALTTMLKQSVQVHRAEEDYLYGEPQQPTKQSVQVHRAEALSKAKVEEVAHEAICTSAQSRSQLSQYFPSMTGSNLYKCTEQKKAAITFDNSMEGSNLYKCTEQKLACPRVNGRQPEAICTSAQSRSVSALILAGPPQEAICTSAQSRRGSIHPPFSCAGKQAAQVHSHPHTTISYQRSVETPRFFFISAHPSFPPGQFFQIVI